MRLDRRALFIGIGLIFFLFIGNEKNDVGWILCNSTLSAEVKANFVSPLLTEGQTAGEKCHITVKDVVYTFCWIPSGSFIMGSPESEEERDSGEVEHLVYLSKGFWMLETEATQQMWLSIIGSNPSEYVGDKHPVDSVGLEDIDIFLSTLSELATLPTIHYFQLPTEAQWEYAARAGSNEPYGGQKIEDVAWFGDRDYGGTHDVGTKKGNDWGLKDMNGNLWEWCSDRFGAYPKDKNGIGITLEDPTGASLEECPGDIRVDRGGCWDSSPRECRNANRGFYDSNRKGPYVGFRFILVP